MSSSFGCQSLKDCFVRSHSRFLASISNMSHCSFISSWVSASSLYFVLSTTIANYYIFNLNLSSIQYILPKIFLFCLLSSLSSSLLAFCFLIFIFPISLISFLRLSFVFSRFIAAFSLYLFEYPHNISETLSLPPSFHLSFITTNTIHYLLTPIHLLKNFH